MEQLKESMRAQRRESEEEAKAAMTRQMQELESMVGIHTAQGAVVGPWENGGVVPLLTNSPGSGVLRGFWSHRACSTTPS